MVVGSLISGRVSDYHRGQVVKDNSGSIPHADRRLHIRIPGKLVSLSGVLMYGWFVDKHIHVAGVVVSISIGSMLTLFALATWCCESMAKLFPVHCPSHVRNDLGLHHNDQLFDRKLQKHTCQACRARKSVPQSGRCSRGCGCKTIDWEIGSWFVFNRVRLDEVLLCM